MSKNKVSYDSYDSDSDSDQSYRGRPKTTARSSRECRRHEMGSDLDNSKSSPDHRSRTMKAKQLSTRSRQDIGNKLDTDTSYKERAVSGNRIKSNDGDYGRRSTSKRNLKNRRYDTDDDDVDSDHEEKKRRKNRRHDSEDEDSDIEIKPTEDVKDNEKQSGYVKSKADSKIRGTRKEHDSYRERDVYKHGDDKKTHNTVEDEAVYGKHEKLGEEDGARKRDRREGGEFRRHDNRDEGLQESRKQEREGNINRERKKDLGDYEWRKIEKEEKAMHERKGRDKIEDDDLSNRKLGRRKDDVERIKIFESREEDDCRTKKREEREENEQREEDGYRRKNREKRDDNETMMRLSRGEDVKQERNRERRESILAGSRGEVRKTWEVISGRD